MSRRHPRSSTSQRRASGPSRAAPATRSTSSAPPSSTATTPPAGAGPTPTNPQDERLREAVERLRAEEDFDRLTAQLLADRRAAALGEPPRPPQTAAVPAPPKATPTAAEPAAPGPKNAPTRTAAATDVAPRPIATVIPVAGMTCRSCEVRIQKFVKRLPNVERVTASAVHGRVEIESSAPVSSRAIEKAITDAGYEVGQTPWLERDPSVWVTAAAGAVLVVILAVGAQLSGLAGLASSAGDISEGGVVVALLLGLAAGVSTCMALVGGLVLALSASFQARRATSGATGGGLGAQMRPALVFMAGRIAGYAVFGAALGAIGASLTLPPQVTAVMMIVVAIVMTIVGTRLTGLSPRIATWSPTLPMGVGNRLGLTDGDGAGGAYSDTRAAALGAASFFLPCGFTQAIQIYALSTGSPVFAAALLTTFAIGTAPGLLALAGLPVVVPTGVRPTLLRLVGVVVIGFALINATAGIRLAGIALPAIGVTAVAAAAEPPAPVVDGKQTLHTYQDLDGYRPANVTIYAGIPTTWTIESTNAATCASSIRIPALNAGGLLHKGLNTIELPALAAGTLAYTCSMGMYSAQITIIDRPTGAAGS